MSLKVWLPLDGDLRNLGTSDVEVTNNGATVDNAGKIGKCYSFDGTNDYIVGTYTPTTNISFCCWAYFPAILNGKHIFDGRNTAGNSGYQPMYMTTSGIQIGGSGSGYPTLSYTWVANTWYHICVTHDAQKGSLYVNGNFISSSTTAKGFNAPECNFTLGSRCNQSNHSNVKLNDVRIYDHCLSAAEVHEIAMGLVLHYKLDGGLFGNPNLYTGSKDFTGTWHNSSIWTTAPDTYQGLTVKYRSSSWGGLAQNISCTNGDIFTISFYGKVDSGGNILSVHRSNLGNVTTGLTILDGNFSTGTDWVTKNEDGTQWKRYWATLQVISSDVTYLQWRLENGINGKNLYICGIKLEKGTVATPWCPADSEFAIDRTIISDSSGYGHHATLTNGLLTTDTPRYSEALILDSSTKAIGTPIFESGVFISEYTWAGWIKRNYTTTSFKQIHANIAQIRLYTDFTPYISWTSGKVDGSTTGNGAAGGSKIATLNEWAHMAITYKSGIGKFYINGELIRTWNYTSYGVYIAAYESNILGNGFIGNLSDIRIYTTELLDTDIKLLYNMGMKVDNLGGVHTFEFDEISNEKLLKTGILQTNELEEISIQLARLQKDKGWLSSEFIEI